MALITTRALTGETGMLLRTFLSSLNLILWLPTTGDSALLSLQIVFLSCLLPRYMDFFPVPPMPALISYLSEKCHAFGPGNMRGAALLPRAKIITVLTNPS